MDVILAGGLIRALQGLASAAPTLIVGLFIAAVFRYYLGQAGTQRLFGGDGLRSLPQAWLVGMLLPVCSIGVIPIIREMKRMGLRPGAITAFALSAPLFNPLSLLYGLTLSRPFVIIGFALGSLLVVTLLGLIWDRWATKGSASEMPREENPIGLRRLGFCLLYISRELFGTTGALALVAVCGLLILGAILPHGALQGSVEQLDPLAPAKMALVAIPIYATPMLTMSQLGMMFAHGNSPGAAFCLLLLGTGMNLATLWWIVKSYGKGATALWLSALVGIVLACAYTVERPLIPPGVEPAGHTHAFDIYTNPLHQGTPLSFERIWDTATKTIGFSEWIGLAAVAMIALVGFASRAVWPAATKSFLAHVPAKPIIAPTSGLGQHVSSRTVGMTCLVGLIAFSVVACYAYYPAPEEVLEEMRLARVEVLSGVASRDYEQTLHWIPILDEWSRKLEVGYAMRRFELRPYQQMQAHLLRKKLELLEHAIEHQSEHHDEHHDDHTDKHHDEHADDHHDDHHGDHDDDHDDDHHDSHDEEREIQELRMAIMKNSSRLATAFQ